MTLYQQRLSPTWGIIKSSNKSPAEKRKILKSARKGDYLIKKTDKFECLCGIGYLSHCYRGDGWTSWSTRENAAWFTKEEVKEITKNWRGIKIVKK